MELGCAVLNFHWVDRSCVDIAESKCLPSKVWLSTCETATLKYGDELLPSYGSGFWKANRLENEDGVESEDIDDSGHGDFAIATAERYNQHGEIHDGSQTLPVENLLAGANGEGSDMDDDENYNIGNENGDNSDDD